MNKSIIQAIRKAHRYAKKRMYDMRRYWGSYLGARAAIEYSSVSFEDMRKPRVIFAGHSINSDYLFDLLELVKEKNVAVNVISKSGTTTEPGIAFRVIRQWMEARYGRKEAASRIIATTDPTRGALCKLATEEGYTI